MSGERLTMELSNTVIHTQDLERACRFYEEKLGLSCVYKDRGLRYFAFMPQQGRPQRLIVREVNKNEQFIPTQFRGPCASWLSYDIEADWAELKRRGVDVDAIIALGLGAVGFCLRDPDGNECAVVQFVPE